MKNKQVDTSEDEDYENGVIDLESNSSDEKLVLELLRDNGNKAMTKLEIADRLGWDSLGRVSTFKPGLLSMDFYRVSVGTYNGVDYYYSELDNEKLFFCLISVLCVLVVVISLFVEYGIP